MIELSREDFEKAERLYYAQLRKEGKSWHLPEQRPTFEASTAYGFTPRGESEDHTVVVLRAPVELMRVNVSEVAE